MKTNSSNEKNLLVPMIIISLIIAYIFFSIWKCTFFPGHNDEIYLFFFTLIYSTAFILISIIAVIRLYRKKLSFFLLMVLLLEFVCAMVFVSEVFLEMVTRFRMLVYEHILESQHAKSN